MLFVSIYAPQSDSGKRSLWSFISTIISRWDGECIVMGDFNEVRFAGERMGSNFNVRGARDFNSFISSSGLVDVQLEGYSFTWSHPTVAKMSKLDRFLISEGFVSLFPHVFAICLDKHLSDHRPILLRDVISDYGATPFRFYHSWFKLNGFEQMVINTWNSISLEDRNGMIRCINIDMAITLKQGDSILGCELQKGSVEKKAAFAIGFRLTLPKSYESIPWDYRDDVSSPFGSRFQMAFMVFWQFISGMASIIINCSPNFDFYFTAAINKEITCSYLFILVMESFHLSITRTTDAGLFKGIKIDSSLMISHLFYVDDAVFIGEWSEKNVENIMHILHCFSLVSGLKINLQKSHLLGVGISTQIVNAAAMSLDCSVMRAPFKYLGVMVGGNMSLVKSWDEIIGKLNSRLSKWKSSSLSIGKRLTLLKSVLGSSPIYTMSLYKVPKSVLNEMESIRRRFFYGSHGAVNKITWVKWSKVLAAKKYGGLGVSSYFTLNRALLFRWCWRFIVRYNTLWYRVISSIHGDRSSHCSYRFPSV
ncbi:RNA-directed DNA polymerase, eukaryota [Tanacetum coccineum]